MQATRILSFCTATALLVSAMKYPADKAAVVLIKLLRF
jgi:hypothetical protein